MLSTLSDLLEFIQLGKSDSTGRLKSPPSEVEVVEVAPDENAVVERPMRASEMEEVVDMGVDSNPAKLSRGSAGMGPEGLCGSSLGMSSSASGFPLTGVVPIVGKVKESRSRIFER